MDFNSATDELHVLELADTSQNVVPGALQIVALRYRHVKQCFNCLHVLCLHLAQVVEERKLGERRNKRVALQLEPEETDDADGALEAVQAELDNLKIVMRTRQKKAPKARDATYRGRMLFRLLF